MHEKMSTRDYISEIIEIRSRRSSNNSHSEVFIRLLNLEQAFKATPNDNKEILKYFPIALVATMEGCFRIMAAELIDHGEIFLGNCDQLLKNQKITFDLIKAFQGKQVSVGEFVSHVVSINKLQDIDSLISTITGKNFLKELKSHRSRWEVQVLKQKDVPIIINSDKTYKNIISTFELRHIFCHETAAKIDFDYKKIEEYFLSASIFLKASVDYVSEIMHPNAPLTQTEMNIDSAKVVNDLVNETVEVKDKIIKKLSSQPDRIKILESSHEKWIDYMKEFSVFSADAYKGGSIRPLIYNTTASGISSSYLNLLKGELESIDEH